MVGRFIAHDGKEENQPLARFGNIAMMPRESVLDGREMLVEAYLVEIRSLPGFSGSPVILHVGPANCRGNGTMTRFYEESLGLLGIDTGHKMLTSEVRDKATRQKADVPWHVLQNTGVSIVAPASKIRDVLEDEVFVRQRHEMDAQWVEERGAKYAASDLSQSYDAQM